MSLFEQPNTVARTEIGLLDRGRASAAAALARGTGRLLRSFGFCTVSELPLASGRRADLVGLGGNGEIVIVEIKSSIADLRADRKWLDYRRHCDRLFFATALDVPLEIFPNDPGLIVADAFGAAIEREAPEHRLAPATRRGMTLRFARAAALRLELLEKGEWRMANRKRDTSNYSPFATRYSLLPYRGARFAKMRCRVRRCMLSRRAVSETLRLHNS